MRIQHNILAMNAYRNYNTNTSALAKNLEKLSSGYKINRAGDDAAGLAISEKMRAQITGLNAAQKNVKDGISLVKTAEGAMQEIQDMLNRMDYLATQSANGTYDNDVDRANLQKEVMALKTEIDRIADSANFNGIKLLDGSLMDDRVVTPSVEFTAKNKISVGGLANATCAQGHVAGVKQQKAEFQIDLKQALTGVKASKAIAANGTFSLKVQVGNASITVKLKANEAVGTNGVLSWDKMTLVGIASTGGTTSTSASGISITSKDATGAAAKATFSVTVSDGVLKFKMSESKAAVDFNSNMSVTISASGGVSMNVKGSANTGGTPSGVVSYNCSTQAIKNGVAEKGKQLAHAHFDLSAIADKIAIPGGAMRIGETDITFNANSTDTTAGRVGIKDLMTANASGTMVFDTTKVDELARRISLAAANDRVFTVGVASDGVTISLEEKYNFHDGTDNTDDEFLDTEKKFEKYLYYGTTGATTGSETGEARGLTLQIGDTSDDFNRLKVSIGDMHVRAMGQDLDKVTGKNTGVGKSIADIDITKPENAQEAINVIKNAINYVSSVRGDLGATQNRLEHTANNLSVMAENIQDAESTIRDTDIAEEMMSYTKNNILVQSAQAMLAQANAVPQGVLQLLG